MRRFDLETVNVTAKSMCFVITIFFFFLTTVNFLINSFFFIERKITKSFTVADNHQVSALFIIVFCVYDVLSLTSYLAHIVKTLHQSTVVGVFVGRHAIVCSVTVQHLHADAVGFPFGL